jgi:hypothetical protein
MAQTITTLQAVEQDIKQKMLSPALSQAVPITAQTSETLRPVIDRAVAASAYAAARGPITLASAYARGRSKLSTRQLLQQRLRFLQIARVKPFSEPAVDRSEKMAGFCPFALMVPEAR